MSEKPKVPNVPRLLWEFQRDESLRNRSASAQELASDLLLLRAWQTNRLMGTYADLLASPRFNPACTFFLNDLYGPRDFSQRDQDVEQLYHWLSRLLPKSLLQFMADAITLNRLTNRLDHELLWALRERLGMTDGLTPEMYAQAYRICDNYEARKRQIRLIAQLLREAAEVSHIPMTGTTIKLARSPVEKMGWGELFGFVARGYTAFHPMKKPTEFADIVEARETHILDRIFADHDHPFDLPAE